MCKIKNIGILCIMVLISYYNYGHYFMYPLLLRIFVICETIMSNNNFLEDKLSVVLVYKTTRYFSF